MQYLFLFVYDYFVCSFSKHIFFLLQGVQTETLPCMYYIPSHGYAQSPYNLYNPNIPGAMLGADDPFIGMQQYYDVPYYEYPMSSPTGFPMVFQSGPEFITSNTTDPYLNTGFTANRTGGQSLNSFTANRAGGLKNNFSWASTTLPTVPKPASNQARSFARVSEGSKANAGPSKLPESQGNFTYGSFPSLPSSSQVFQVFFFCSIQIRSYLSKKP